MKLSPYGNGKLHFLYRDRKLGMLFFVYCWPATPMDVTDFV